LGWEIRRAGSRTPIASAGARPAMLELGTGPYLTSPRNGALDGPRNESGGCTMFRPCRVRDRETRPRLQGCLKIEKSALRFLISGCESLEISCISRALSKSKERRPAGPRRGPPPGGLCLAGAHAALSANQPTGLVGSAAPSGSSSLVFNLLIFVPLAQEMRVTPA
jgi:hypothetical protein